LSWSRFKSTCGSTTLLLVEILPSYLPSSTW
jgi:hypothetical protein